MAGQKTEKNNVVNMKKARPIKFKIENLIFIMVFIYVLVYVIISFQTEKIIPYEVKEGSLAVNYTYRAIAIRQEQVVTTDKSGYVSYFAREGERVALGDLVYAVDETGQLKEYTENIALSEGKSTLSEAELIELRSEMVMFTQDFDNTNFSSVYDFKIDLKSDTLKLSNTHILNNIDAIQQGGMGNLLSRHYAVNTGILTYYVDGYEEISAQDVNMDMFDEEKYEKKQFEDNAIVTAGEPIYKLSKSENWSLVMPIEPEMAQDFLQEEYIKVRFLKNQYESWGEVFIINGSDGNTYMELRFTNSMVTFAKDRFVDIELQLHDEVGLKIPNSSIVNKEFFLVPEEFITVQGDSGMGTVLRERYKEDGTVTSETLDVVLYNHDTTNKQYYVEAVALQGGDNLVMLDSQKRYTVGSKGTLIGVYYMNKGYADFRQIQILYQNEEYSIVKSNTKYGLNVYDYVVLNASSVSDEQFIYQ